MEKLVNIIQLLCKTNKKLTYNQYRTKLINSSVVSNSSSRNSGKPLFVFRPLFYKPKDEKEYLTREQKNFNLIMKD